MPRIIDTKVGKFMVLPNDSLGKELIAKADFEPHFSQVIESIIKQGDVCVDCGANLGYHTVGMAKITGTAGHVVAFEPLRVIYQQLCGNVFLNDLRNVTCFNTALGNANEAVQMDYIDVDAEGINIGGTKIGSGGNKVNMMKIDDLGLTNVKFIKIDVQGCEVRLLAGAQKTIDSSRPIMFIEVENQWLRCFDVSSEILLNTLLGKDYILVRINTSYPCDHIAIPLEKKHLISEITQRLSFPVDIIDGKSVKLNFDRSTYSDILYGTFDINYD